MSNKKIRQFISLVVVVIGAGAFLFHQFGHAPLAVPSLSAPTASVSSTTPPTSTTVPESSGAQCRMRGQLPDPICTPGIADPHVTQSDINQTICVSGYTKTVRPSITYTDSLKRTQMSQYGFSDTISLHEEDHLISLELGGSPSDPKNLWPEPHASPNPKDSVENSLHAAVCQGKISLQDAQHRIATDWVNALSGL